MVRWWTPPSTTTMTVLQPSAWEAAPLMFQTPNSKFQSCFYLLASFWRSTFLSAGILLRDHQGCSFLPLLCPYGIFIVWIMKVVLWGPLVKELQTYTTVDGRGWEVFLAHIENLLGRVHCQNSPCRDLKNCCIIHHDKVFQGFLGMVVPGLVNTSSTMRNLEVH